MWPELNNPPVEEAVLDFRFVLPNSNGEKEVALFFEQMRNSFPTKKERVQLNLSGKIVPPADNQKNTFQATHKNDGIILNSADQKTAIQLGANFFSYHIIKPYRNWPAILEESRNAWNVFLQCCTAVNVNRIALRYINRISVPNEDEEINPAKYLKLLPSIPDSLPHQLENYFMQINIANEDKTIKAIVNETIQKKINGKIDIIFDIDTFKVIDRVGNNKEIWDDIIQLREFKNKIFFNSITQETLSKFQ